MRIDPDGRSFIGAYGTVNHTGSADVNIFDGHAYAGRMREASGDPFLNISIDGVQYNSPPGTSGGGGSRSRGQAVNDDLPETKLSENGAGGTVHGGDSGSWYLRAAAGYIVFLKTDLITPNPTDAAWPKWLVHGILGTTSAIVLILDGQNILNPDLEGMTTSRGNPDDWSFDPEIRKLQNDRIFPSGRKPPPWLWPAGGAAFSYELYKNWPKPDLPQPSQPVDNTYVAPRPTYLNPN